jgi:S-adenosylmethionine synthetase
MHIYEASEAVSKAHPDKVADQISDAILDACLEQDPLSRVAVETLVSHTSISIGGEITSSAKINLDDIVRSVLNDVGYTSNTFGDLYSTFKLLSSICEQSPDISQAVGKNGAHLTAGDQGIVYGYACDDTPNYMPRSHEIAREIVDSIQEKRIPFLGPDGKVLVSIHPSNKETGSTIVSWQHSESASLEEVRKALKKIVEEVSSRYSFSPKRLLLNPSGRFVLGGPFADTGLTGRKQIVDSYGNHSLHGGGAYSGKDATKVDRSGAYMARWVAKHIVASRLARSCQVQLIFSIGESDPLHIELDCHGTETIPLAKLRKAILQTFDFSVEGIISSLNLTQPLFRKT